MFFLISIISSEMLVTNWKLVTGMIGNQLNHSKIIELHCGYALQPLKVILKLLAMFLFVFPHFDHIFWNVSHKLKISNRNDRESTKPLKNHRIALQEICITTFKSDSEVYKCFYLFFLISIISPEMLVTNWKLVTGNDRESN